MLHWIHDRGDIHLSNNRIHIIGRSGKFCFDYDALAAGYLLIVLTQLAHGFIFNRVFLLSYLIDPQVSRVYICLDSPITIFSWNNIHEDIDQELSKICYFVLLRDWYYNRSSIAIDNFPIRCTSPS